MAYVRWEVDGFRKPTDSPEQPTEKIQGIFSHVFIKEHDLSR